VLQPDDAVHTFPRALGPAPLRRDYFTTNASYFVVAAVCTLVRRMVARRRWAPVPAGLYFQT
jgi:hypothetical protein